MGLPHKIPGTPEAIVVWNAVFSGKVQRNRSWIRGYYNTRLTAPLKAWRLKMLLSVTRYDRIDAGAEDITIHDPRDPRRHFYEKCCFRRDHVKDLML
jgi:hypothetical protein